MNQAPANPAADIQQVLFSEIYQQNSQPRIADVKQVIDTLKEAVQPLTPVQMQVVGYLENLQSRPLHGGKKPYEAIISRIVKDAPRVAPPSFFIRVIEALIPRTTYIDGKSADKIASERDGKS